MTLRCLNCGEKGLRDEAEFCDKCGAELVVKLDDSIPMFGVDADVSASGALKIPTTSKRKETPTPSPKPAEAEDGGTTNLPINQHDSKFTGATTNIPDNEGATTYLTQDQSNSPADGATSYLPTAESGQTAFLSDLEELSADDGGTSYLPGGDGATTMLSEKDQQGLDAGATSYLADNAEGATTFLSKDELSDPNEGATSFLSDDDDEGGTKFLSSAEETDESGMTQAVSWEKLDSGLTQSPPVYDTRPGNQRRTGASTTNRQQRSAISTRPQEVAEDGATQHIPLSDTLGNSASYGSDSDQFDLSGDSASDFDTNGDQPVLRIHDRYQLSEILGKGGFGAVYLAEDVKLRRRCVVKQMLTGGKSSKEIEVYRINFGREASLLAELNDPGHPNIPEIYDYFSLDSGNYLVMKYIEGQNLKEVLAPKEGHKLPWEEAVRYAIDVCSALHYMHNRGGEPVMHRDVKPANIQLGDDGRVWLVDFGLARANPVTSSGNELVTQASGSFGYTPLEQWFGKAIPSSDIYAIGATLHHLITGIDPLEAYNGEFHIQKIQELHGQLTPIRAVNPDLPESLEQIIDRAVAADPEHRPTALQLQRQLEAVISGAQTVTLYTFRNGQSAETILRLVDLCEKNRREAEEYLYSGDFERWFLLINRNDLAAAASQAVKHGKNRRDGLEKFLKLILPNIARRRLNRAAIQLGRGLLQFVLIAAFVILLLGFGGSYIAGLVIRQFINSVEWDFYALELDQVNSYNESFLERTFTTAVGAYLDDIEVEITAPEAMNVRGRWDNLPLNVRTSIRMGQDNPRLHVTELNGVPLFVIGNNISQGINNGIDDAFQKSPVDVSSLIVRNGEIDFEVKKSDKPSRPEYGTPTPAPSPTPTPLPTPTPVNVTLVVVFNDSSEPVTLEIEQLGRSWDIGARDTEVLQTPPGTYNYTVKYQGTDQIAAQGTREWVLNKAYRLRINVAN